MANVSDVVCSDARASVQKCVAITITISFSIIVSVLVNHGDARGEGAIDPRGEVELMHILARIKRVAALLAGSCWIYVDG